MPAKVDPSMRGLKILVAVMGVMLVVGLAVVIGTIVHRATQRPPAASTVTPAAAPAVGFGHAAVTLPAGARVLEMHGAGERLVLLLQRADGSEMLLLIDPNTGAEIGTVDLKPGN